MFLRQSAAAHQPSASEYASDTDVLGQLSLDVRRRHTGLGDSKVAIRCPGNGPQYEGTDDRVPHIKRSFLAGAETFEPLIVS